MPQPVYRNLVRHSEPDNLIVDFISLPFNSAGFRQTRTGTKSVSVSVRWCHRALNYACTLAHITVLEKKVNFGKNLSRSVRKHCEWKQLHRRGCQRTSKGQ